jgi:hypothetical protein
MLRDHGPFRHLSPFLGCEDTGRDLVRTRVTGALRGALGDASLWERELAVPARSQMVYPNGGETWCSPVSLWMVMAYWADRTGREDIN